jgi:integrase/recombinase XerD
MLERFFDLSGSGPGRVRALRSGSHGSLLESFSRELVHSRYANLTARRHLRSAEHYISWANQEGRRLAQWDSRTLDGFGRHLRRRRCSYGHAARDNQLTGASIFLEHLRATGIIQTPIADSAVGPALLVSFRRWMREERGTLDISLRNYDIPICQLLQHIGEDVKRLDAVAVRRCFLKYCDGKGHETIRHAATALRMFLRFLISDGECPRGLESAIPVVPHWRLSSLPRYLQPDEVERIVASCDMRVAVGKRDRAILLLLARLGLRAGDIVQMRLNDIDWKDAWIQVCGKGRRPTRLPLTREVGDAVVRYLQDGRPPTDDDRLFVCCRAPFRPFASHAAVSVIVTSAMSRAGVTPQTRGAAHLLRHSVATSLLREGVSLQDIATLLRHRSVQTTQIYAKVDVVALHQVVQAWPEVRSC